MRKPDGWDEAVNMDPSLAMLDDGFFTYRDFIPEGDVPNDPVKLAVALEGVRLRTFYESRYPRGFWARLRWLFKGDKWQNLLSTR